MASPDKYPTMVIPSGTDIRLDGDGQLSIRTSGNLVIQNSGTYGELESSHGSIRIEEKVSVEALNVRAAEGCFVEGTLTAWRVKAKKIVLEGKARACIMIPEAAEIEVGKGSKLVGNFGSDDEVREAVQKFSSKLQPPSEIVFPDVATEVTRFGKSTRRP